MKKLLTFLILNILIWTVLCYAQEEHTDLSRITRFKRAKAVTARTTTTLDKDAASCLPYKPTMPNFHRPGGRISETKCYEYAWQKQVREEKDQREKTCTAYNRRKAGFPPLHNLVVGGKRAEPGEYPQMAALGLKTIEGNWTFKCGGTLISPRFVLTAGHCTYVPDPTLAEKVPKMVRLGVTNLFKLFSEKNTFVSAEEQPHDETISRIIVHPSYAPPRKYNDIALLQLSRDVGFTKYIQPACLWTSLYTSSINNATVTGWGTVKEVGGEKSPDLLTAPVDIINSATCSSLLKRFCNNKWCGIQDTQLCAGKLSGGIDTCQGDSGGPLSTRLPLPNTPDPSNFVIGVTSFGFGCARADVPGVYTRVAAYTNWIEQIVWH